MDNFLSELASRKWRYYQFLHKRKPQAYTSDDCYERIKVTAKYNELLDIINDLPPKEQMIIKDTFDRLTEFF
jgi:hypothetical protein